MKSPHQARPTSTPRKVTLAPGIKLSSPMSMSRTTPSSKKMPRIYSAPLVPAK